MLISKILNNNVVISEENQEEVILMGRGLAFGRKVGQEIPDELIEKKYVLSENRRQLLMELPAEVMEMSDFFRKGETAEEAQRQCFSGDGRSYPRSLAALGRWYLSQEFPYVGY